jgi:uncharacterized metal-binding protein YceD (DUF177 family)
MSETPEFSRRIPLDRIGAKPHAHAIVASADECAALARRFGIPGIDSLTATVTLARVQAGRAVNLTARFRAAVVQACVVTLDPVPDVIEEDFAVAYEAAGEDTGEIDLDPDPDDASVEPLPPDAIDIGESVAQQVSLCLEPYPRSPRAALDWPAEGDSTDEKAASGPFSALKALKADRKTGR